MTRDNRRRKPCWQCKKLAVPTFVVIEQITPTKLKREFCNVVCAHRWMKELIETVERFNDSAPPQAHSFFGHLPNCVCRACHTRAPS